MTFSEKVTFSWPYMDRFGKIFGVKLKVYQISADLVNRELRNTIFEGKNTNPHSAIPSSVNESEK